MATVISNELEESAYFEEVGDEGQIRHVIVTEEPRRSQIDAAMARLSFSIRSSDVRVTR